MATLNDFIRVTIWISTYSALVQCFNVETNRLVVDLTASGQQGNSLFGYTVALKPTSPSEVLVGAPSAVHNGYKSGIVYSCNINTKNCEKLGSSLNDTNGGEGQSHEFRGVSMATVDNEVMVGASRWFDERKNYLGRVTVLKNDKVKMVESPCEKYPSSFVGFSYCMAGFSMAGQKKFNSQSTIFVTGMPGALKTSGALFTLYNNKFHLALVREKLESSALMGYSTAIGTFSNSNEYGYIADIVGGAPKANNLNGKVTIYKISELYSPTELVTINGPQDGLGSYFGASVAAVDLNNDGKDDLLIGSPHYAEVQDEGRVYVYMNRQGAKFNGFDRTIHLDGDNEQGARFGSSIANIGDINNDGYKDIAIGAPYGGPNDNGVVYIYNGGRSGLRHDSPQRVFASDMPSLGKGFGISISGGVDVDNNGYPDLVIGAYQNDHAYVIRTRAVIQVVSSLYSNVDAVPNQIHDDFKCPSAYPALKDYNCVNLILRLKYEGKSVPDNLDFEFAVDIDVTKLRKRAMTLSGLSQEKKRIQLKKNIEESILLPIAVKTTGELDWTSPIEFISRYEAMIDTTSCVNTPCPMLDQYNSLFDRHQMVYSRHCASAETCSPDLKVTPHLTIPRRKTADKLIYGRDERIIFSIDVLNSGEAAYQSKMKVTFHSDLHVIGVNINEASTLWEMKVVDTKTKELIFFLENPIASDRMIQVEVKFSLPIGQRPTSNLYIFKAEASSFGIDPTPSNNIGTKSIDVSIETCIGVVSEVKPSQIQYELNAPAPPSPSPAGTPLNQSVAAKEIGTQVKFTFIVKNNGNLPVDNLEAGIIVPIKNKEIDMVYVTSIEVDGIICNADYNELNYTIETSEKDLTKTTANLAPENKRRRSRRDLQKEKTPVCTNIKDCKIYLCPINRIEANQGTIVTITTRLWDHNLPKINPNSIEVALETKFTDTENNFYEQRQGCNMKNKAMVSLDRGSESTTSRPIPWWVILLSIIGALIILGLLIAVLFKCGFFKRDRNQNDESNEVSPLKNIEDVDE